MDLDKQLHNILAKLQYEPGDTHLERSKAEIEAIAAIHKLINEAQIQAIQNLKRAWKEERKMFDYSPATYDFIADKEIARLTEESK